ncbi:hypothetical protein ACS0TY_004126 [Phlomoides rotata]
MEDGVVKEVSSGNRVEEAVLNMDIDENRHDSNETILEECPIEVECSAKNKPKAWSKGESSKIFKSNRAPSIDVRLKFMKSDSDVVEIPSHGISRDWDSTLIRYFTGRFPGLKATHDLCKKWGVKYSLSNHDSGWLLFKLSSEVDVESVLNGGPYSIWGRTLMLKKMPFGFRFNNFEISVTPVWIKLKFLPMCCWNTTALSLICSKIGRPIHSDRMTLSMERVSYVRVLVEVDAAEPLVREVKVLVEGVEWTQPVEYEFEPKYCKICGKFGHGELSCPSTETWEQKRAAYFNKEDEKNRKNEGSSKEKNTEEEKGVDAAGFASEEGFTKVKVNKKKSKKEVNGRVSLVEVGEKITSKGKGRFDVLQDDVFEEGVNLPGSGSSSNFYAGSGAAHVEAFSAVFSSSLAGGKSATTPMSTSFKAVPVVAVPPVAGKVGAGAPSSSAVGVSTISSPSIPGKKPARVFSASKKDVVHLTADSPTVSNVVVVDFSSIGAGTMMIFDHQGVNNKRISSEIEPTMLAGLGTSRGTMVGVGENSRKKLKKGKKHGGVESHSLCGEGGVSTFLKPPQC